MKLVFLFSNLILKTLKFHYVCRVQTLQQSTDYTLHGVEFRVFLKRNVAWNQPMVLDKKVKRNNVMKKHTWKRNKFRKVNFWFAHTFVRNTLQVFVAHLVSSLFIWKMQWLESIFFGKDFDFRNKLKLL